MLYNMSIVAILNQIILTARHIWYNIAGKSIFMKLFDGEMFIRTILTILL